MGVAVLIVVMLAVLAGGLVYAARARREAERTAAELDQFLQQHRREDPEA